MVVIICISRKLMAEPLVCLNNKQMINWGVSRVENSFNKAIKGFSIYSGLQDRPVHCATIISTITDAIDYVLSKLGVSNIEDPLNKNVVPLLQNLGFSNSRRAPHHRADQTVRWRTSI